VGKRIMLDWERDKRWSDKFLNEIKAILGVHLIGEPPIEEDMERNTDLMVLKMDAVRIGCRVRNHQYFEKYPDDFTIRSGRPTGAKTELAKIIEGWGQYLFYAFADEKDERLVYWRMIDLNKFRLWFNRCLAKGKPYPWVEMNNRDNSSSFHVFNVKKAGDVLFAMK